MQSAFLHSSNTQRNCQNLFMLLALVGSRSQPQNGREVTAGDVWLSALGLGMNKDGSTYTLLSDDGGMNASNLKAEALAHRQHSALDGFIIAIIVRPAIDDRPIEIDEPVIAQIVLDAELGCNAVIVALFPAN